MCSALVTKVNPSCSAFLGSSVTHASTASVVPARPGSGPQAGDPLSCERGGRPHRHWATQGSRHDLGGIEDQAFLIAFLRPLRERSLLGLQLVISDAHASLKKEIAHCSSAPVGSVSACTLHETCWLRWRKADSTRSLPPCARCPCSPGQGCGAALGSGDHHAHGQILLRCCAYGAGQGGCSALSCRRSAKQKLEHKSVGAAERHSVRCLAAQ